MNILRAGIFHSGVEVYDVEYAYGGERNCILPYGLFCICHLARPARSACVNYSVSVRHRWRSFCMAELALT